MLKFGMATEFDTKELNAQLAELDDYEIERRIEREIFEGKRLKVAKKILEQRRRDQNRANSSIALGVGSDLRRTNHLLRLRALRNQRPHLLKRQNLAYPTT